MSARERDLARERQRRRAMMAATRTGLLVWAALLALMAGSLTLAYAPLGPWHLPAAVGIAALQVVVILLFVMDLRRAGVLTRLAVAAALLFVLVMFGLTFNDLFHRV